MKKFAKKILLVLIMLGMAASLSARKKQTEVRKEKKLVFFNSVVTLSDAAVEILTEMKLDNIVTALSEEDADIDTILSYKPDFVFLDSGKYWDLEDQLDEEEIKWFELDALTIDELKNNIMQMGSLINHRTEAASLVNKIDEELAQIDEEAEAYFDSEDKPGFYVELSNDPYTVLGNRNFICQLIESAGAKNIFSYINAEDMTLLEDIIIDKAPDYIFISSENPTSIEEVLNREGWENVPAVQNGKVYVLDIQEYSKAGPSCTRAIRNFFNILTGQPEAQSLPESSDDSAEELVEVLEISE